MNGRRCFLLLYYIYSQGAYGQEKDVNYANLFSNHTNTMDNYDPPQPVKDFDKRFPSKPVLPYKAEKSPAKPK